MPLRRGVIPALSILPTECAVRRAGLPAEVERCRGVLRGAQRQQVGERVNGDQRGGTQP